MPAMDFFWIRNETQRHRGCKKNSFNHLFCTSAISALIVAVEKNTSRAWPAPTTQRLTVEIGLTTAILFHLTGIGSAEAGHLAKQALSNPLSQTNKALGRNRVVAFNEIEKRHCRRSGPCPRWTFSGYGMKRRDTEGAKKIHSIIFSAPLQSPR